MDPITQGTLGAAAAQSVAGRRRLWLAGALGLVSGIAPDLDVFIRSDADPLLFLEYHRQFTHALVFIPVGGLLCALVLHGFVRRQLRFRETALFCVLGYATHGLLDACTSYGTQLLWPFSEARVAWNSVSVVDPLLSGVLALLLVAAVLRRSPGLARLGLVWVVTYLGFGALQQHRAVVFGSALADARGHTGAAVDAKPSFGNLLLWRTIYRHDGRFHVDAVRLGRRADPYFGASVPVLDPARDLPWLDPGSRQAEDLERFRRLSGGYVAIDPRRPTWVTDVRYAMVPTAVEGLWAIELDPAAPPDQPVRFVTTRGDSRAALGELLDLLFR